MEFGVASWPANRAGAIDRVSGSKELRVRPCLDDDPSRVIAENLGLARLVVAPRRFVSTGLTDTALTSTRRSRPEGLGRPTSISTSDCSSSIGSGVR